MRAVYMPAGAHAPIGIDLHTPEDFFCLAELVQAGLDGMPAPAIVMSDGTASTLLCANTVDGVVIVMSTDDEHSYHGVTPDRDIMSGGTCTFMFMGARTPVPSRNTVSMSIAHDVVSAYFTGGFPQAMRAAAWEADQPVGVR
ncbi:MAG: hypothetical protein FWF75_09520 [Propionibacteriaceae bacterium]|nr:hypothetical protein [Propionibacteriaceae bacterium]